MKHKGTLFLAAAGVAVASALGAGAYQRGLKPNSAQSSTSPLPSAARKPITKLIGKSSISSPALRRSSTSRPYLAQAAAPSSKLSSEPSGPATPVVRSDAPDLAALKARRQEQRVAALKGFLSEQGLTDEKVQSVVIEQLMGQEEARRTLQEAGRKLFPVLGHKGQPPVPEAQVTSQIEAYDKAVQAYSDARRRSTGTLEAQLGYSKNPHLRAVLVVLGLIGDGPAVLPL